MFFEQLANPFQRLTGVSLDTEFVTHYIRVMRRKLRNVTVTLEEDVARWARFEAAQRKTSVSRYLAEFERAHAREGRL